MRGYSPRKLAGSASGVFVGISANDYQALLLAEGEAEIDGYLASGTSTSIAAGRISYMFGLHGPSMAVDTACSSSLVAVHLACQSLRAGECRMVLAGGVNVILSPDTTFAFSKAHMMAGDGRCKAFDAGADGFVRAEGCGMVVLKRLRDAEADGDRILAVIRGSAVNQDGRSSGLTAPNGRAQEAVIRAALAQAGVKPEEVSYVEAHGTGTALGDPIEAHALAAALGAGRGEENPLMVGSVKTNVGHLEAAAGIAGLIKVVLSMQHGYIPASLHFKELNPHIDWGGARVEIAAEGREWKRGARPRVAGVSSFGFSGTNAHVIVEEAPEVKRAERGNDRGLHLLALSARSEAALRELGERYAEVLEKGEEELGDICYTAGAGRAHFEHRVAAVGATAEQVRERVLAALPGVRVKTREGIRAAYLFPGQGSQYAGMGKELYETQPVFRRAIEECSGLLEGDGKSGLEEVLWGKSSHLLDETAYTQPCLFAVEYGLARLWGSWGIEPSVVLGHSVGEFAAAWVAGVFSLEDGLKLIARRGRLMQEVQGHGGMAAVWAGEKKVRAALEGLEEKVGIAALNGPESVVISGYERELEEVKGRLEREGIRVQRLRVSHGFHSPQMREMEEAFEREAAGVKMEAPRVRMISSVTGRAVGREELSRGSYWREQVSAPVRFAEAMGSVRQQGIEVFLEVGPGGALSGLGRECIGAEEQLWMSSVRSRRGEWEQMLESLGELYVRGAEVDWAGYDQPYRRRKVSLPTYPFERQRYWLKEQAGASHPAQTDWQYRISWQPKTLAAYRPDGSRWLVTGGASDDASELVKRMRELGGDVSLASSPEVLANRLRDQKFDFVLHIAEDSAHSDDIAAGAAECVSRMLGTAQTVLAGESGARVWIVTSGAQPVGAADRVNLLEAPLWGFGKALALEHPDSWGGLIDLDAEAGVERSAAELLCAIQNRNGEDQIALRGGTLYVARLNRVQDVSGPAATFSSGKTYLITGGLGGLGLSVAAWMVERGAHNLVLISRRPPSESARQIVESLQRQGARVEVCCADAASRAQMEAVFNRIRESMPPLAGVIHAAGVLEDSVVSGQSRERIEKAMAPKVAGAWNLHQMTEGMPLDFFVLFSSASAF